MKRLNLIPKDIRFGPFYRALSVINLYQTRIITGGIIFAASAAFIVFILQSVFISKYRNSIEQESRALDITRAKSESLKILIKQYGDMETYISSVTELARFKLAYLTAVKARPASWSVTLGELRRLIPKRVWLYALSTEKGAIKIEGGTFDEALVSVFMSSLKGSSSFSNVNFGYTKRSRIGGTEVVNFELTCNYNLGAALQ